MKIKKYSKQKENELLRSKIRSYSLLAAGMIAGVAQVDGAVIYTDVDPDDFLSFGGSQFNIDLDGDGTTDINVGFSSFYIVGSNYSFSSKSVYAYGAQYGNQIQGSFSASALYEGQSIGPGNNFNSFGSMARLVNSSYNGSANSYGSGSWLYNGGQERFLGVQFDISGQVHYGWIRMVVDPFVSNVQLLDYAYESNPNTAISAGDVGALCPIPNNIGFSAFTYNAVTYAWDTVGNASGYEIRGGLAQQGSPKITLPINNPAQSSFGFNNLNPGTIYSIEMRTFCGTDSSDWSPEILFQPPACNAPASTFVTNLTASSVTLNWSLDPGPGTPAAYNILGRAVGSSAITSLNVPHPTNTFQVNNLPSGVAFEWAVVTVCTPDNVVRSGFSPVNTFTTLGNAEKGIENASSPAINNLTVAPNPITGVSTIRFNNDEGSNYQLTLTDMSGKIVRTVNNITANQITLEKENLASGMYVLELRGKEYFVEKVLVD